MIPCVRKAYLSFQYTYVCARLLHIQRLKNFCYMFFFFFFPAGICPLNRKVPWAVTHGVEARELLAKEVRN